MSDKDLDDIQIELKERRADERAAARLRILISDRAYRAVETHANEDTSRELGGVLVGEVFETEHGTALLLEDAIRALHADRQHASVKFTHDTWAHINSVKDAHFPDKRIVAWYHSHPNFGIFLSDFDKFIQNNFFNLPWQVAYVVDPVRDTRGFFKWEDGQIVEADEFHIYSDTIRALAPPEQPAAERPRVAAMPATGRASLVVSIVTAVLVVGLFVATLVRKPAVSTPDVSGQVAALDASVQNLSRDVGDVRDDLAQLEATVNGLAASGDTIWIETRLYTVQRADTLQSVSKKFYGDPNKWNLLRLVNGLGGRTRLNEGEVLRIPTLPPPPAAGPSKATTAASAPEHEEPASAPERARPRPAMRRER
ncbi:MAG: Mov34/MPN/PAD-1 family protein [Armatimonadota bacterium]